MNPILVVVDGEASLEPSATRPMDVQWREVFEHSLDAALLTSSDGRVFAANPVACKMFGRTEAELCRVGRAGVVVMDELVPPFLEERARSGKARGELNLKRADGTTFRAEVSSGVFAGKNGTLLTSMSIHDLTERRRASRTLELLAEAGRILSELDTEQTLQRMTSLFVPRLADLCIVDVLEDGEVRRVAVAHRDPARVEETRRVRRTGRREDSAGGVDRVLRTGQPELVPIMTDEYLRGSAHDEDHLVAARAMGITSMVIVPLIARGRTLGAFTIASTGGVPSYDEPDLHLAQAIGVRAALALDNAREHAAALAATRLRDEVLSVVSHDLGNALNTVGICTRVLASSGHDPELDAIQRTVDHAKHLIRDLLLAAKMDFATVPIERGKEDIRAIFDQVTALHHPAADAKSLQLVVRVDPEVPAIEVDRHRMVQMLDNLLGNAIKFTAEGRVNLRARADAGMLVIEISDTGAGIAPEDMPHVFDRFWQSAHARRAGVGLGLAIARGVAVAHGGDITVRSTLGRGTTFVVTLPLGS